MQRYILKRIINMIPTLIIVAFIVFAVTRIIPGDPAATILGPQASLEEIEKMRIVMKLDQPLYKQFFTYIGGVVKGNLGYSYAYTTNVSQLIAERFPNTLILTSCALLLSIFFGVLGGIISSYNRNSLIDYIVMILSLVGVSMPIFWLGVMLVLLFSVKLGWLPATGMPSSTSNWTEYFKYLIIPSVALATIPTANFARITRSSMLEVLSADYIKTARSKGLKERVIIWKHALKNALNPILSVMGMQIAGMLGGSVLTETIFSWPGMGKLVTDAIERRDLGVIQGVVIFIALIYVVTNLIIDILYKIVNPKISYE